MGQLTKKAKITFWISGIFLVFVIGGVGGVFTDKYLFPRLSTSILFKDSGFFKKANESVTIINKTEQVTVREDDSVNQIASRAATSVVNIISLKEAKTVSAKSESKSGTGVLVTGDGVIATYRDVIIEKDSNYVVLLYNNDKYDAKLLGIDNFTNLAYLKIESTNLPSINFANSDDFKPGKKLVSIGNSFNEYQNRYSAGLLSNINKTLNLSGKQAASSEKLEGVFETDFDNQSSYLGGPLISYNGDLVGIVGSVFVENREHFFQIPSNVVKNSLERMLDGKLEQRAVLGLYYISVTKEYSLSHRIDRESGALVFSPTTGNPSAAFVDGSPAQKSGLRVGDIITEVNGKKIDLSNPLSNVISSYNRGDKIELLVYRGGEEHKIGVQM